MRTLNSDEMLAVFGGDNPGMGPYAAPITAEVQAAYMNAWKPLIALTGHASGLVEVKIAADFAKRAAEYNVLNGYNREGTVYQWPYGAPAAPAPVEMPPPTEVIIDFFKSAVNEVDAEAGESTDWESSGFDFHSVDLAYLNENYNNYS